MNKFQSIKKEGNPFEDSSWYAKTQHELFEQLKTSATGLSQAQAEIRLRKLGFNELLKKRKASVIFRFLKQFNSPLIYILLAAAIISFIFEHSIDSYVILAIIFINATIGFVQERKAERAIEALEKLIVSYAKVYRNNELKKLPSRELVPGDIILLEEGDKIPADVRLLEIKNFRTQESSLTGESLPVEKTTRVLEKPIAMSDKINMALMSTIVVSGFAKAVVVATAGKTEIGQVAESLGEVIHPKTHFSEKVQQLAVQMAIFAIIGASLTFLIGYFLNKLEFFDILLFTIASLVSGIPEGLPAVLAIVLAIGAQRMARRKAIIRHLPAVETLGVATVIATDKTGTLTQNSMTVENIFTLENEFSVTGEGWEPSGRFFLNKTAIIPGKFPLLKKILLISSVCNKGELLKKDGAYETLGDPTEIALLVLGKKAGFNKELLKEKIIDDLPFSSELKFRASIFQQEKSKELYSIGAFETLLDKSAYTIKNNKKIILDTKTKQAFLDKAVSMAKHGMRVLGIAYKQLSPETSAVSHELVDRMVFLALIGMKDPPRKEIREAIAKARRAGIRIIMKTGDHKQTALAIAREIGLATSKTKVLTQDELEKLSKEDFERAVQEVDIFARVIPQMKMKIIQSLQKQGEIVAMTGDGVNDAPALKKADIGIAMGIMGTDVAREASEMVLADDNFASIVNAIEQGRIVFQNIRQTSFFLVTTNVAEDFTIISSLSLGFPLPMLPIQLLYLNLVTDTFNGVALAMEPGHNEVLNHPPVNKKEKILNSQLLVFLLLMAGLMALGTIPLFRHFLPHGMEKARTIAFVAMSMFQLFNVLNMRSLKKSLFKIGFFSNKWVTFGLLASFLAMLAVIYLPGISAVFQFVPLKFTEILIIILISSSVFIAGEVYKFLRYGKANP